MAHFAGMGRMVPPDAVDPVDGKDLARAEHGKRCLRRTGDGVVGHEIMTG